LDELLRKCREILGLNATASESDITDAFDRLRAASRRENAGPGASGTGGQWERLKEITWARDTLLDHLRTHGGLPPHEEKGAEALTPPSRADASVRSVEAEALQLPSKMPLNGTEAGAPRLPGNMSVNGTEAEAPRLPSNAPTSGTEAEAPEKGGRPWWLSSAGVIACALLVSVLFYVYGPSPRKPHQNVVASGGNMVTVEQTAPSKSVGSEKDSSARLQEVKKAVATVRFGNRLGSAFLVSDDGYLVTNFHVVDGAKGSAQFANGDTVDVHVVKIAPESDFALLKTASGSGYPYLKLGDSSLCREGDPVFAVGSPVGLQSTFTKGIISAKDRRLGGSTVTFIQTDAAVNHGNSGGPLINPAGEVLGINTAVVEKFVAEGLNFAISINDVKALIEEGRSRKGPEQAKEASNIDSRIKQESRSREALEQQRRDQAMNTERERDKTYRERLDAMKEGLEKMKKRQALDVCLSEVDRMAEQQWNDQCARMSRSPRCTLPRDVYVAFNGALINAREECVRYYGE
jgi:S1-C subfamily serine protease